MTSIVRPYGVTDTALVNSNVDEVAPAAYAGGTTYATGERATVWAGTVGTVYASLQDANTGNNPATEPAWWQALGVVYALWDSGTTYAADAVVALTSTHKLYQSTQASNTNHNPEFSGADWWVETMPTNRWAMFDDRNGTQTKWFGEVSAEIAISGRITTLALLELAGTSVNVTIETTVDGEIYSEDHSLVSLLGIDDWWPWLFEPITYRTDLLLTDLPNDINPTISFSVTGPSEVRVGNVVAGREEYLGEAEYGLRLGRTDYSRIEEDRDFGVTKITRRGYSKIMDATVWTPADQTDYAFNLLADLRATPVLMIGTTQYVSAAQYGLVKDFRIALSYPTYSVIDVQFQGL